MCFCTAWTHKEKSGSSVKTIKNGRKSRWGFGHHSGANGMSKAREPDEQAFSFSAWIGPDGEVKDVRVTKDEGPVDPVWVEHWFRGGTRRITEGTGTNIPPSNRQRIEGTGRW
jgi:hypothetical protein